MHMFKLSQRNLARWRSGPRTLNRNATWKYEVFKSKMADGHNLVFFTFKNRYISVTVRDIDRNEILQDDAQPLWNPVVLENLNFSYTRWRTAII